LRGRGKIFRYVCRSSCVVHKSHTNDSRNPFSFANSMKASSHHTSSRGEMTGTISQTTNNTVVQESKAIVRNPKTSKRISKRVPTNQQKIVGKRVRNRRDVGSIYSTTVFVDSVIVLGWDIRGRKRIRAVL
jgi:hypothetical protein